MVNEKEEKHFKKAVKHVSFSSSVNQKELQAQKNLSQITETG